MTTLLLSLGLVALFLIALISPRLAGKIQKKTDKKANLLKRCADWFWDPITWWARKSIEFSRKSIQFTAKLGKKGNKKARGKD